MGRNPIPLRFLQLDYWGLGYGAAERAPTRADHKSVARIADIKEE
jgi:hypothetical protein